MISFFADGVKLNLPKLLSDVTRFGVFLILNEFYLEPSLVGDCSDSMVLMDVLLFLLGYGCDEFLPNEERLDRECDSREL